MNKYILKSMSVLFCALLAASCTSSFDEVNTDPDKPLAEDVPSTNILAYCERYASDNMFDEWFDLNESCGFSGQIAKWMYTQEGYYNFRPTVNSSSWRVCDYVAANLKSIIDKEYTTKENGDTIHTNMWAVATIFQCQIFQIKSDRWGNIPYWTTTKGTSMKNEAYRLESSEGGITAPAYDKQSDIYPDLLARLAEAVEILEAGEAEDEIGDGDVMLGGNTDSNGEIDNTNWIKYANALRLRIAARIANVDPTLAKQTFEDVMADKNIPADNDDNIFFEWNAEYAEPWADYYNTRKNEYGVSQLMVNALKDLNDPRLEVYATKTRAYQAAEAAYEDYQDSLAAGLNPKVVVDEPDPDDAYIGYPVGTKANAAVQQYSQIGNRFQNRSAVTGFSPWLRSCEVYFALAYAASKGWNVGMDEQAAYEKAVTLSLEENGVSDEDIKAYLAQDDVKDVSEDNIFTQWWISVYKNGQEAWSIYRMAPVDTWLFQNNHIAVNTYYSGHNCPPMCYGYPDTERNLNSANCEAEAKAEDDYFWGKQMWWDTREGLQ